MYIEVSITRHYDSEDFEVLLSIWIDFFFFVSFINCNVKMYTLNFLRYDEMF
jgi:hypothetical protein